MNLPIKGKFKIKRSAKDLFDDVYAFVVVVVVVFCLFVFLCCCFFVCFLFFL